MRRFAPWTLLCLTLTLAACSSEVPNSGLAESEQETAANPVIVVMGGFNSCLEDGSGEMTPAGSDRWNKAARLSAMFAQGEERWVRSCFDKRGNLYFISSQAQGPRLVRTATVADPTPFFESVSAATDGGRNPVYMIGHSHGGWLAMYTAYWLASDVNVRRLVTVDPISPENCTPMSYIAALAGTGTLQGCQEAPADFDDQYRAAIIARLPERAWNHYYQTNFFPLHSSAFPGTAQPGLTQDLSPFLQRGGTHPSWNAHSGIDELGIVWSSFETTIARDLGR